MIIGKVSCLLAIKMSRGDYFRGLSKYSKVWVRGCLIVIEIVGKGERIIIIRSALFTMRLACKLVAKLGRGEEGVTDRNRVILGATASGWIWLETFPIIFEFFFFNVTRRCTNYSDCSVSNC